MLDSGSGVGGPVPLARGAVHLAAYGGASVPGLELRPQRIVVASVVDARFSAS